MKFTKCELDINGDVRNLTSDDKGCVIASRVLVPNSCLVRWHQEPQLFPVPPHYPVLLPDPTYRYHAALDLSFSNDATGDLRREDEIRLHNLGYQDSAFDEAWRSFQVDYGLNEEPWFHQATHDKLVEVHAAGIAAPITSAQVPSTGDIDDFEEDGPTSPCGDRLRLFDRTGNVMTNTPFRLTAAGKVIEGNSLDGWIPTDLIAKGVCTDCLIEWGAQTNRTGYSYSTRVMLNCADAGISAEEETLAKLHNLGFSSRLGLAACVTEFQVSQNLSERGLTANQKVPSLTLDAVRKAHERAADEASTSLAQSGQP